MVTNNQHFIDKTLAEHDAVLLKFSESDAKIARNWQYPTKANSLIVCPSPILV